MALVSFSYRLLLWRLAIGKYMVLLLQTEVQYAATMSHRELQGSGLAGHAPGCCGRSCSTSKAPLAQAVSASRTS